MSNKKMTFRLAPMAEEVIQRAAELTNKTPGQFMVDAAIQAAEKSIEFSALQGQVAAGTDAFNLAMNDPPDLNLLRKLRDHMDRRQVTFVDEDDVLGGSVVLSWEPKKRTHDNVDEAKEGPSI